MKAVVGRGLEKLLSLPHSESKQTPTPRPRPLPLPPPPPPPDLESEVDVVDVLDGDDVDLGAQLGGAEGARRPDRVGDVLVLRIRNFKNNDV